MQVARHFSRMKLKATKQASCAQKLHQQWVRPQLVKVSGSQDITQSFTCRLMMYSCQKLAQLCTLKRPRQEHGLRHLLHHHSKLPESNAKVLEATGISHGIAQTSKPTSRFHQKLNM